MTDTAQAAAWITIKAAAEQSGFSRSQIYRWLAEGAITGKKLGRGTYILAASLNRAIDALPSYNGGASA